MSKPSLLWKAALLIPLMAGSAQAAVVIDLTAANASETINGAIFTNTDNQATGSGVIQSFVRISANTDVVQGINTSDRPLNYDENTSPTFTHNLLLADVPIVNGYREFLLDINQTNADSLLSLDRVQIYVSDDPDLNSNTLHQSGSNLPGATLIYDMDATTDYSVKLDYALNSGSGSGDLFLYVPDSLFSGKYVYLYSRFGELENNNDGFEEWAVRTGGTVQAVPAPAGVLLGLVGASSLGGYAGLGWLRRRKA